MYILKIHYEATEKNNNFFGKKIDYYYGVKNGLLSVDKLPTAAQVEIYGYKTLAGAKAGFRAENESAEWETACGYWKVSVELLEV